VAYHAWRGWTLQWVYGPDQQKERETNRRRFKWLRCFSDAILYAICSIVGFASLHLANRVIASVQNVNNIGPGATTLAMVLGAVGVLGVTCQLPHLIQQGKILPK
jgi:hypothetical protein